MVLEESGIEFDFSKVIFVKVHDKPLGQSGDGNILWKGVDFRVELPEESIWLEVKNWDSSRIPLHYREAKKEDFVSKMKSEEFGLELRAKFFGTTAFLAWTDQFAPRKTVYVVLLQPPPGIDRALLGTQMQQLFAPMFPRKNFPWTHNLSCAVMDLDEWNKRYPELPARSL